MRTNAQQIERSQELLDRLHKACRKARVELELARKDGSAARFIDLHRSKLMERAIVSAIEELGSMVDLLADAGVRHIRAPRDGNLEAVTIEDIRMEARRQRRLHEEHRETRSVDADRERASARARMKYRREKERKRERD